MKHIITFLFCCMTMIALSQKKTYLLAGTYTSGKSKGIYVYNFLPTGKVQLVDSAVTPNPSYLAISPNKQFVYAVNELGADEGGGQVSSFRFNHRNGKLTAINQQPAEGEHPCYITIDRGGKWAIVGNYSSGNVAVLPIKKDGSLVRSMETMQHTGKSLHQRQEKPHVHATVLSKDNTQLYVPDLGIDKLMIYSFNAKSGTLDPKDTTLTLPAGSGPRHLDIHPTAGWVYLLQELTGMVTVLRNVKGRLQPTQTISVLPAGFNRPFTSADIHVSPDGRFLYTSTRDEANIITVFSIQSSTGRLTVRGHYSTLGKTPRNFTLDPTGKFLLVANQQSNEVVVFKVNRKTGALTDSGNRIDVGNPVCLKWIEN